MFEYVSSVPGAWESLEALALLRLLLMVYIFCFMKPLDWL